VPDGEHPLRAKTTSAELLERGRRLAVNGDFFFPWHYRAPWDYYPHEGDPVSPSASDGANHWPQQSPAIHDGYANGKWISLSELAHPASHSRHGKAGGKPPAGLRRQCECQVILGWLAGGFGAQRRGAAMGRVRARNRCDFVNKPGLEDGELPLFLDCAQLRSRYCVSAEID
jgi:hypothetical protein